MENPKSIEQQKYDRAVRRVNAIAGFYRHLLAYLAVNTALLIMAYSSLDPGEKFFSFGNFSIAFFWGLGLALHAIGVFTNNVLFGRDWEEKKIKEFMHKENSQRWE